MQSPGDRRRLRLPSRVACLPQPDVLRPAPSVSWARTQPNQDAHARARADERNQDSMRAARRTEAPPRLPPPSVSVPLWTLQFGPRARRADQQYPQLLVEALRHLLAFLARRP